jgi:hypothetical protein
MLATMDPRSAAEELPELYRALLDRVAQLDAAGHRSVAYRMRARATAIYSRAWDDRARRGLEDLLREAAERSPARGELMRGIPRRSAPLA